MDMNAVQPIASRARLVFASFLVLQLPHVAHKKTGHHRAWQCLSQVYLDPLLQEDVAVEIYLVGVVGKGKEPGAIEVGAHYGISAKAVRDIW